MRETLYLIDGFAQIFRAYYAIRGGMHSPVTSEPTHAVFGFTAMLLKLLAQYRPHYVAVAFDAPGKTFRDELHEAYKGTREATPDDLISQIPRIKQLIELFGIPVAMMPGLEADDVIATITDRVVSSPELASIDVRIVSKDKDLEQLIEDRVALFDIHNDETIGAQALLEKKGIRPDQVVDYLMLVGDSVDNVPGVPGIGPKTAAELLQQYGDVDGIYAHIEEIKGKRRENLEASRERIPLTRDLVTLRRDGNFHFSLEDARVGALQVPKIVAMFQELGFNRFQDEVRRLADIAPAPVASPRDQPSLDLGGPPASLVPAGSAADGEYRAVKSLSELEQLARDLGVQEWISFDTETTGLERNSKPCGLAFAWEQGKGVYVPTRSPDPSTHLDTQTVLDALRPILESDQVRKCGHNLKFDAKVLLRHGVHLRGVCFDSMLAGQLIDPSQASQKLDHVAMSRLNYRMIPISDLIGEGDTQKSIDQVPLGEVVEYAAEDADVALRLRESLLADLDRLGMRQLLEEVEAPLSAVIAEMEHNGIRCDPDELRRQGADLGARAEDLKRAIYEAAGTSDFQIESTKQLAELLFNRLGFKPGKKTKTGYSTDSEVLDALAAGEDAGKPHTAVPRLILEYRQLTKLISTYLGNLVEAIDPRDGRIHTTFHQLVTATGRLASHGPNLQNIPIRTDVGRQIRKAFVAEPGNRLICADYSQVELRLLAHLSGDTALCEAFAQDLDIHTAVASQVFGVPSGEVSRQRRDYAKTINFGIIYGVTPFGLSRRIEGLDVPGAEKLISDYNRRFPGIQRFMQECVDHALTHGYVATILGRRRAIPELKSPTRPVRELGQRLAINSVVQGSGADLIKTAMVHLQRRIDREQLPMRLLLQIHDELVLECPEASATSMAEIVREEMERAIPLRVPLKAEAGIGADWLSAK